MKKIYDFFKGKKRHIGGIIFVGIYLAEMFGAKIPPEIYEVLKISGFSIYGIGVADKVARSLTGK